MVSPKNNLLFGILILLVSVLSNAIPVLEQEYRIEAFQRDGDPQSLILRIQPRNNEELSSGIRQARQEDEDDDDGQTNTGGNSGSGNTPSVPNTTPFIPAIIPALTKIFSGIFTGNLNEIVHGSTSFAPQNISFAIDSVYNQVVGIAAPISTTKPTRRAPVVPSPEPETLPLSPSGSTPQSASLSTLPTTVVVTTAPPSVPQSAVITTVTTTTSKPASNEDDEDESDAGFPFRRLRLKKDIDDKLLY